MKHPALFLTLIVLTNSSMCLSQDRRPRISDLGIKIGIFKSGKLNAITDVAGLRVGHTTLIEGDSVRTGITAILPHGGNMFKEKVPGAIIVGNGFGKLVGFTQVEELGQIETPIVLTNTLSVWTAADAVAEYVLALPGNENVRSVNPVVGETNDGTLNDIRGRHVKKEDVLEAIRNTHAGDVEEGSVGAGTGTICFGWKGGIGTSSRLLPPALGGYTLGVLVQTNYGGILDIAGVPVGKELDKFPWQNGLNYDTSGGSCMIVVATDAPLTSHELKRLARRALLALGRTGSAMSHGSGDYVIAFSTAEEVRIHSDSRVVQHTTILPQEQLSPLFQAVVEATEEAIYNSLFAATTVTGRGGTTVEALPIERVKEILTRYGRMK